MRRFLLVFISAIFALALASTAALAAAGFHYANSSVNTRTGALSVSFKETGLGNTTATEHVTLTVNTATANYQCLNKPGHNPAAENKRTVSTSLNTGGDFANRNGQTTGTLTVGPPGPGDFSCTPGQHLTLVSVTYSGIFVTGSAGDTLEATPDPISAGPIG